VIVTSKEQLRAVALELSELVHKENDPQTYYAGFARLISAALNMHGAAYWLSHVDGNLTPAAVEGAPPEAAEEVAFDRAEFIAAVRAQGETVGAPLPSVTAGEEVFYLATPVKHEGRVVAVVEVFRDSTVDKAAHRDFTKLLKQLCKLAEDWHQRQSLLSIETAHSKWNDRTRFLELSHLSLDQQQTAFTICHEARTLIGCDRVSVAVLRGRKIKVEAISAQDTVEHRAEIVKAMTTLADRVVKGGGPLWCVGAPIDEPPQIEQALDVFADKADVKTVIVLPLHKPGPPREQGKVSDTEPPDLDGGDIFGALIVENAAAVVDPLMIESIRFVHRHGALALANAVDHSNLFLLPLWKTIGRSKWLIQAKTLPKTVLAAICLLAVALVLFLAPADFDLQARGSLQPAEKRELFAPTGGVVRKVHVDTGDVVSPGQLLLEIDNPDLLIEEETLSGELQTSEQELRSIHRELLRRDLPEDQRHQLTNRQSQSRLAQRRAQEQLSIVQEKIAKLTVRSPAAGEVVTWDLHRLLDGRPVSPGQRLLTIADSDEPWRLELLMPENRIGHVAAAQQQLKKGEKLQVDYVLSSDPSVQRQGTVAQIDAVAATYPEVGQAVKVRVDIEIDGPPQPIKNPKPGATVTAQVNCGSATLGYVLCHELFEWVQENILF